MKLKMNESVDCSSSSIIATKTLILPLDETHPVVLGCEDSCKDSSTAMGLATLNTTHCLQEPTARKPMNIQGGHFLSSHGGQRQGAGKSSESCDTNWGLRIRLKPLHERGQAHGFTSQRPPRRVLRPHHLGTWEMVKAANLARLPGV